MAQENNQILNQPLMAPIPEQEILLVDKVYARAYDHFEICVVISGIYSFLKACIAPFFIFLSQPHKSIEQIWLYAIVPLSICHTLYYWRVRKLAKNKNVFLGVANQVRHAAYFMPDQVSATSRESHIHENICNFRNPAMTEVQDKEVKILSLEIKYDVLKQTICLKIVSRFLFIMYTILHIWGYIIFISVETPSPADYLIIIIIFLGTYQYLEIYLAIVGLILVLPFLLIYLAVKAIKKRRKNKALSLRLKGQLFNPLTLKGEHVCHICMDEYKQSDKVSTLPCNQMHHFHQKCLTEWIKVSGTCPLCRIEIQIPQ